MAQQQRRTLGLQREAKLLERAIADYRGSSGDVEEPTADSGIEEHLGVLYAVLRRPHGVLAVYRVHEDDGGDRLELLDDWPPGELGMRVSGGYAGAAPGVTARRRGGGS